MTRLIAALFAALVLAGCNPGRVKPTHMCPEQPIPVAVYETRYQPLPRAVWDAAPLADPAPVVPAAATVGELWAAEQSLRALVARLRAMLGAVGAAQGSEER